MASADIAVILVYAFVSLYFLSRFLVYRKWPSLGIALMPMGWITLALASQIQPPALEGVKWTGVGLGVALIVSVLLADREKK